MVRYQKPKVNFKARRKSVTIPDQSLSIKEIVRRYVRGIPVDVVQREGVYIDQNDHDLEKLSRMDFGDKAEYADMLRRQAEQMQSDLKEAERSQTEAKAKAESDAKAKADADFNEAVKRAAAARAQ